MANAKSKIHLVYDGWTSDHNLSLFKVQARYFNEYKRLQTILLSLPQIYGEHTGEKFADIAFAVTERYQFIPRLGFTITDNAGNNNTMVDEMERQMAANGYIWDAKIHRLRCLGHIINLAAEDFFYKDAPDPHNQVKWRQFGCYGKIHNIVL